MLGWIAALALAPTQVTAAAPPLAASDWWEKVTVTLTGDGKPQACVYETSGQAKSSADCSVVGSGARGVRAKGGGGQGGQVTRITFERRFHSGITLPAPVLHPGDTLLGREVMKLAIDAGGKVSDCKVVSTGGDMTPDYGCAEASTERFEANAHPSAPSTREGFMTITIYGHNENVA